VEIPPSLRAGIDAALAEQPLAPLRRLAAEQSDFYRSRGPEGYAEPLVDSEEAALAYAAWRLPATFASAYDAFRSAARCLDGLAPTSMLDLGAGPGTAMWAASAVWPSLSRFALVEQSAVFVGLGKRLAAGAPAGLAGAEWRHEMAGDSDRREPFELVTICNLLGELTGRERARVVEHAWEATTGLLVAVEPGTTQGSARILEARARLVERGAHIVAPCPHDAPCPMSPPDWCHFSTRVPRSRTHRIVKGGSLGYEDERYAYVAAARAPRSAAGSRLVHTPKVTKGDVLLDLCGPAGLEQLRVPRRDKAAYRRAKKARWGELFDGDDEA